MTQTKRDEMSFFNNSLQGDKYDQYEEDYYEEVFSLLKLSQRGQNKILLDVGCGSGAWGIRLAKKGYIVVGVDISKTLVKTANAWANAANVNFMPILCDVERLPIRTETFHICFCGYVLHHFKRLNSIFSEISRVLKIQGEIFAVEPNGSNMISKLSRNIMTIFPQQWVMKKGIATSNERVHEIKSYINVLKKTNFMSIQFLVMDRKNNPLVKHSSLIDLLGISRKLLFDIFQQINVGPTGKTELLIRATRQP
jgi:ubiquinone/menaquinone biosynthesis C-methylase UbiE